MLNESQIRDALHAARMVPLDVANPHGPLGLEQLAQAVTRATTQSGAAAQVQRPLSLPLETWQKLDGLARAASRPGEPRLTASGVAAALIHRLVTTGS